MTKLMLLVLASVSFLTGCASVFELITEKPKVELREVYFKDTNFVGTTLVFVVNLQNPNRFDIRVKEIEYKVFLSEKEFSSAKTENPFTVIAHKTIQVELPLPVKYGSVWEHLTQALVSQVLSYRIEGRIKLSFTSVPFSKEGKVKLK
ncbi:MAG: LEA type 2 family protein [Pseudobdellovibrionaceae bacterium]